MTYPGAGRSQNYAKGGGTGEGYWGWSREYQGLNWTGARRNPATPMIWVPPPVVRAPLHPKRAPVVEFLMAGAIID